MHIHNKRDKEEVPTWQHKSSKYKQGSDNLNFLTIVAYSKY